MLVARGLGEKPHSVEASPKRKKIQWTGTVLGDKQHTQANLGEETAIKMGGKIENLQVLPNASLAQN